MPAKISNTQGSRHWVYGPDGKGASRATDGGVAVLVAQVPSLRPQPPRELGSPGWQHWMPTLKFSLKTGRFVSEFEVERQRLMTLSDRVRAEPGFHIVWSLDYSSVWISTDGSEKRPAADLGQLEWLEFDMLLLGLLCEWPTLEDEEAWLDDRGKHDRVVFLLGGRPGGTWDPGFARALDGQWQTPSANKLRGSGSDRPRREGESGWRRVADAPSITNSASDSTLAYRDVWRPTDLYERNRTVFIYESGGRSLPVPVVVPDREFAPPVWQVVLPDALLMADGWSLERILGARSEDERRARSQALAATVPNDPITIAQLVNGVVDALLHWQPSNNLQPRPPKAVALQAITNDIPYWPYLNISASIDPHYFRMN